jgi:DNA-binding IclR family transcriptional regulator
MTVFRSSNTAERRSVVTPAAGSAVGTGAVKSADRVLTLLEYLADVKSASFSEIVNDLELPNSSAHQLLQTVVHRGFFEFEELNRTFRLGFRLWEIAQSYSMDGDLATIAQPLMEELTATTTETVQLAKLDGLQNVYLAISESPHPMKLVSAVGMRLASHATGLGKVLLGGLEDGELERRLQGVELEQYTDRTITDHRELLAEVRRTRNRGYGEDNEEYVRGCRCVAMPLHDSRGDVVAALSVTVPTARYNQQVARDIRAALRVTVSRLEQRLGVQG